MKKKQIIFMNFLSLYILMLAICSYALASGWELVYQPRQGVPSGWINQLMINPNKPDMLFAGTEGAGFVVSGDGGKTWTPKNEGLTVAEEGTVSGYQVRGIAMDPAKPETAYLGMAAFGVFKSTDGGNTWADINSTLGDTFIKAIVLHPAKPEIVYVGTDGGGLYRYDASKDEWEEIIEGLKNTYIKALIVDPKDPKVLYVATDGGICKTSNGGDEWEAASEGLTTRYTLCIAMDPKNSKILYAGTDGSGLFKTEDGGAKWTAVGGDIWMAKPINADLTAIDTDADFTAIVSSVVVNPSNSSIVYAANQSGVFRSADTGNTWVRINEGLTSTMVKCLAVSPTKPVTLYAGTSDGKLFSYKEE